MQRDNAGRCRGEEGGEGEGMRRDEKIERMRTDKEGVQIDNAEMQRGRRGKGLRRKYREPMRRSRKEGRKFVGWKIIYHKGRFEEKGKVMVRTVWY